MPATELAPDVRNRVRTERRPADAARPTASGRAAVERFGSTRLRPSHHWVAGSLLVLAGVAALVGLVVT